MRRLGRGRLTAAVLLVGLVWLVAYPLVLVLLEGVREPSGWTLKYVRLFLDRPTEWEALWGSLLDLARERGPRGSDRDSARFSFCPV